jgi:hypothetical protein
MERHATDAAFSGQIEDEPRAFRSQPGFEVGGFIEMLTIASTREDAMRQASAN